MSRLSYRASMAVLLFAAVLCVVMSDYGVVDAAKRRALNRKPKKDTKKVFGEWVTVMKWTWMAVFAPMLAMFIWQIARDPALPHIIHELWARLQDKLHGRTREESIALARRKRAAANA